MIMRNIKGWGAVGEGNELMKSGDRIQGSE
jgi:hypothetical protein